ncbi:hypothetical protein CES85_1798 [Ochrobactrum quorumnocens]|uniref:Uncharacterized protein n=1 Tax=Ochrobactrum quorumnocens TaxID=271865 RepID=A0A248UJ72_9HYPH|nr:hypothetical protein CES85_1798 [[Ochrobactrum] quorumnocens]
MKQKMAEAHTVTPRAFPTKLHRGFALGKCGQNILFFEQCYKYINKKSLNTVSD